MAVRAIRLKQQIRALLQKPMSEWADDDTSDLTEAIYELNCLGWKVEYPGEGQVRFKRINLASRSEVVRLGYVPE
jgi:hypothetical protein